MLFRSAAPWVSSLLDVCSIFFCEVELQGNALPIYQPYGSDLMCSLDV